jgi:DNA-binding NtrC family response regulator
LERTTWNRTAAAQQLQIPLRTLMHKIQAYGLSPGPPPTDDTAEMLQAMAEEDARPRAFKARIREFETELLLEALRAVQWNRADAARKLRIPLSTLLYKLKAYDLEPPEAALQ